MKPAVYGPASGLARTSGLPVLKAVGWPTAVAIHAGRLLRRWLRSPAILISAFGMPVMMMLTIIVMFRGMVEQFTGATMELTGVTVMVAVSTMLTGALMGAGSTVQERHEGLMDRINTFPGHGSAAYLGRIVAETLRAFLAAPLAMVVALLFGADFGSLVGALRMLAVLLIAAIASGTFGVMMGYLAETPQGAVAASPVIMAATFFNTAMMSRELYAPALRPVVDASPITAVADLAHDALIGDANTGHLWLFVLWFGGLTVLSITVVAHKVRRRS